MEQLRKKPSKLLLVSSSGGHLKHLTATFDAWQNYERVWVSFKQPDVESALAEEKVYWAYYPTTRNVKNAIRNLFLAFKIFPGRGPMWWSLPGRGWRFRSLWRLSSSGLRPSTLSATTALPCRR